MNRLAIAALLCAALLVDSGAAVAQAPATTADRKTHYEHILRTYLNGWETRELSHFESVLAPGFVDYMYGELRTRDELLKQASEPDPYHRRITIDDIIAEGELVVVRVTNHLTHPGTGRTAKVAGMIIARIVDGQMVEGWGVHDRLGTYLQLGVITAPELVALVRERLGGN